MINNIVDRFLKYVSFHTTSDEDSGTVPSAPRELELARYLRDEMINIGLSNVLLDGNGYVYGFLPSSEGFEGCPAIGFIAHMDTSPDAPGENIKTKIIKYAGGDIEQDSGSVIAVSDFPFLKNYEGQELIITDGTTLLGADDKAGIAEIITAAEYLLHHPEIKHGPLAFAFTPDEEIGCGADYFNVDALGCEYAYTVDGGALGELEYENFNAASAKINFKGLNIHPGTAKDKMKNAVLFAAEYVSMLPEKETPAHTEGYEGFYHVQKINGDETSASVKMIIRDHDRETFERRKAYAAECAERINAKYGAGTAECQVSDSYYNMKEKILPVMHVIERAEAAMKKAGVKPITVPIRGGTDGARLSFMGLPCPNLSTGGENFHSVKEFVSIDAMKKMVEIIVNISQCDQGCECC